MQLYGEYNETHRQRLEALQDILADMREELQTHGNKIENFVLMFGGDQIEYLFKGPMERDEDRYKRIEELIQTHSWQDAVIVMKHAQ